MNTISTNRNKLISLAARLKNIKRRINIRFSYSYRIEEAFNSRNYKEDKSQKEYKNRFRKNKEAYTSRRRNISRSYSKKI